MAQESKDTLLARWLEGKLTPTEKAQFESSEAFEAYQRIIRGMEGFRKPEFPAERLKTRVMDSLSGTPRTQAPVYQIWMYASAAVLAIILGLGILFAEKEYETTAGQQLTISLPGRMINVRLNAGSQLTHQRYFWSPDKGVKLVRGEAFFEVTPGTDFHVETAFGTVRVLGTQFNIRARDSSFLLACYRGKVQFERGDGGQGTILSKGESLEITAGTPLQQKGLDSDGPDWLQGRSLFQNEPLSLVLQELEVQYGLNFTSRDIDLQARFTGSFAYDDLETALKSVFLPMGIRYEIQPDQQEVILSPSQ